ncbi:MAG: glutamine synthetase III [Veillonella sp.]|nr:glutamine synthetase III [Veillonella sp.]
MKSLRFEVVGEAFKKHPIDLELPAERPSEYYGINVFNKEKMYKYLPADAFKQMVNVMEKGAVMERTLADKVADRARQFAVLGTAMRLWNGATNGLEAIGVLEENQKSGKGVNPLMQMYPLDRYLPIQIFLTGASELADKAEREIGALQKVKQRREQEEALRTITKTPSTANQSNIKEVIKNPNKRQELIQGINQEKPKELKGRKAETLSNDELVNIYNAYREQKGQ